MIIRHDLRLLFIHVPKCAGKQLRWILKTTNDQSAIEELWNYEYNEDLERYVDMAHLPLSDLRHYPQFRYLDEYTVIACIRNPYMRLASAANEYYRQKSKEDEKIISEGNITTEMKNLYYRKLRRKHEELDPRFIHSLPMHRFTHYGREPKIDYLLKCETLKEDIEKLAHKLDWPMELRAAIPRHLSNTIPQKGNVKPTIKEKTLAEALYKVDFETFGYQRNNKGEYRSSRIISQAGSVQRIHRCESIEWHWGPKAVMKKTKMKPTRGK